MGSVPRERFVPEAEYRRSYSDRALSIGYGQTISQPWIVAAICEALELRGEEKVLEVGTGSGYSAAVLARLAASVTGIERIGELGERAREILAELEVTNVEVVVADGSLGLPGRGPFDAIAVHAAAPAAPESLISQLSPGGRLVAPVTTPDGATDMLTVFEIGDGGRVRAREIGPTRFVPLIGDEGFAE